MYLTVKETAELIRMSERHTYKLIQKKCNSTYQNWWQNSYQ